MTATITTNEKGKETIERILGISVNEVRRMSAQEIDNAVAKKLGLKNGEIEINTDRDPRIIPSGSIYIAHGRFSKRKEVKKAISRI